MKIDVKMMKIHCRSRTEHGILILSRIVIILSGSVFAYRGNELVLQMKQLLWDFPCHGCGTPGALCFVLGTILGTNQSQFILIPELHSIAYAPKCTNQLLLAPVSG